MTDGRQLIIVGCESADIGWHCTVTVGEDPAATTHRVSLSADDIGHLGPPGIAPEQLVEESFAFMLEREPRESILREFELPVIGRFFPEYEIEIRRRLGS
jgi:hypothetical protein